MSEFENKYQEYLNDFTEAKKMVLSTSKDNIVSSRMMSVIRINDDYYFQTDVNFKKYEEILSNNNVALCIDNIQIEGIAKEIGKPLENKEFVEIFKRNFLGSFNAYSALENERLFKITPIRIERWKYIDSRTYLEEFDVVNRMYKITEYVGK